MRVSPSAKLQQDLASQAQISEDPDPEQHSKWLASTFAITTQIMISKSNSAREVVYVDSVDQIP